jgi:Holliday junction resolvase RusA-like endonuclease
MIAFTLSCVPPTASHHRKRIVRIGGFARLADKPELVAAKQTLDALLLPFQPAQPVAGPVAVTLAFTWPWRASEPRKRRALGRVPHTSRPDIDNLSKTFIDRLVALRFLDDDNAVVDLHVTKWWGDEPGITGWIRTVAADRAA